MDKATQTMIDLFKKENLMKHGEVVKLLKDKHALTHGFTNLIALKAKGTDADSAKCYYKVFKRLYAQLRYAKYIAKFEQN